MRRSQLLEDATNAFMKLPGDKFRQIFRFSFEGEPALDAGGVAREWYEEITKTLFDLNFGLFCGSSDNQALYQINRDSGIANGNHLVYFRFAGRLIAKALFDGQLIKPHLVRPLYKHIIGAHLCLGRVDCPCLLRPLLLCAGLKFAVASPACRRTYVPGRLAVYRARNARQVRGW